LISKNNSLRTADDPCCASLKLLFLDINVIPDPVSNKKLPVEDVWKSSNSAPTGANDVLMEHVKSPPTTL
jgi:hypothetical protein